ncbi:hypothetical protein H4219_001122 [Mycoemilia scoparia]|uniref:Cystinosin n=1 Tax=Mycoemilia scoparia TaxID=417184 RepID=A0A9W8DWG5_9FUNG|nr:hypothetical protein H4219_001122 [Mycoemilia scoparia]
MLLSYQYIIYSSKAAVADFDLFGGVEGLSIDFLVYNAYGFLCYSVYNLILFFGTNVDDKNLGRDPKHSSNLVRFNDVFFACHGFLISAFVFGQSLVYHRTPEQKTSLVAKILAGVFTVGILITILSTSLLNFAYFLSYIKLVCSTIKYIPQAWINYKRKSTVGWSIHNIILDFTGGVLSFSQLILDAGLEGDIKKAFTNPGKLGLGLLSIAFDILFIVQHYILYVKQRQDVEAGEQEPELVNDDNGYSRIVTHSEADDL